jgi:hypothetical protein
MRLLFNQPALEVEALHATGLAWSAELVAAGIPPSKWDEMFSLARRSRPSASKAFMVVIDQVIDAWDHYLRGEQWDFEEEAWRPYRPPIVYCGNCQEGYVFRERVDKSYGRTQYAQTCLCLVEHSARNSYHFRRFSAAYELRYGTPYEASESDSASLWRLRDKVEKQLWDRAVEEYFSAAENHTLGAFCESWTR